ncbi:CapA family protein [Myxococcota bacterium]|nr:CapA family protein [Myxococcota bacterium]MBU1381301.1 CapA family protein [Myxococcota bacterium]MBU1498352.1 CapA family protein [Myxococcota bacterium]
MAYFLILLTAVFLLPQHSIGESDSYSRNPVSSQPNESEVILTITGDIMGSDSQLHSALNEETASFDFLDSVSEVGAILRESDLTIGNLETTLAGKKARYTGYPMFNTPETILDALKEVGFDVLTTANNHALDRGLTGLISTIKNIKNQGFMHTGTYANRKDYLNPFIITVKGIKICIVAETMNANGLEKLDYGPETNHIVRYIGKSNPAADVQRCKNGGSDITMIFPHWGTEYQRYPDDFQKKAAEVYIKAGYDLIIGSHPHFPQPFEIRKVKTKDHYKNVFIAWSLGNFISGMTGRYMDTGLILKIVLGKDNKTGKAFFKSALWTNIWLHREWEPNRKLRLKIIPVSEYLFNPTRYRTLSKDSRIRLKQVWKECIEVPGTSVVWRF